jgi:hypothetical protein
MELTLQALLTEFTGQHHLSVPDKDIYWLSQESPEQLTSLTTCGMLLHHSVGCDVDEQVAIQGHSIRFCTV